MPESDQNQQSNTSSSTNGDFQNKSRAQKHNGIEIWRELDVDAQFDAAQLFLKNTAEKNIDIGIGVEDSGILADIDYYLTEFKEWLNSVARDIGEQFTSIAMVQNAIHLINVVWNGLVGLCKRFISLFENKSRSLIDSAKPEHELKGEISKLDKDLQHKLEAKIRKLDENLKNANKADVPRLIKEAKLELDEIKNRNNSFGDRERAGWLVRYLSEDSFKTVLIYFVTEDLSDLIHQYDIQKIKGDSAAIMRKNFPQELRGAYCNGREGINKAQTAETIQLLNAVEHEMMNDLASLKDHDFKQRYLGGDNVNKSIHELKKFCRNSIIDGVNFARAGLLAVSVQTATQEDFSKRFPGETKDQVIDRILPKYLTDSTKNEIKKELATLQPTTDRNKELLQAQKIVSFNDNFKMKARQDAQTYYEENRVQHGDSIEPVVNQAAGQQCADHVNTQLAKQKTGDDQELKRTQEKVQTHPGEGDQPKHGAQPQKVHDTQAEEIDHKSSELPETVKKHEIVSGIVASRIETYQAMIDGGESSGNKTHGDSKHDHQKNDRENRSSFNKTLKMWKQRCDAQAQAQTQPTSKHHSRFFQPQNPAATNPNEEKPQPDNTAKSSAKAP